MKFSFINPGPNLELPSSEKRKMIGACLPLGILYIATVLREEGVEVSVLDQAAGGFSVRETVNWVKREDPDILGFSILISSSRTASILAKEAKLENPNLTIVFGSFHATFNATRILETYPFVDVVVRGEGERTCIELVNCLKQRHNLKDVLGISFRKGKQIISAPDRPLIKNINSLPIPDRKFVGIEYHNTTAGINVAPKKFTTVLSSRGCVFKCRFCGCTRLARNLWRPRTAENILKELSFLTSEGYEQFMFVDDNFTLNQKRAVAICDEIRRQKIDLEWICEGRVDQCSRDLFQKMAKAGCKMLYFGIESGNQHVLDYYKKNITPEQSRRAVELARKCGIDVIVGSFIVGAPNESRQDIENTLKFAEELDIDIPQFNILSAFTGTDIWDELSAKGILDQSKYWESGAIVPDIFPNSVPTIEIRESIRRSYRHFLLRPKYIAEQLLLSSRSKYRLNVILNNISRIGVISESLSDIEVT